jgi:hypothetical protein
VHWGLVDEATARECVRLHVADVIARLVTEPDAVALFVPYPRAQASALRFAPEQVLAAVRGEDESPLPAVVSVPRRRASRSIRALNAVGDPLGATAKLSGCVGAALFDRSTGTLIASRGGESIDRKIAWTLIRALQPTQRTIIAEGPALAHFATALPGDVVAVVAFSLEQVTLGLARTLLNGAGLAGPPPAPPAPPRSEAPPRRTRRPPAPAR